MEASQLTSLCLDVITMVMALTDLRIEAMGCSIHSLHPQFGMHLITSISKTAI